MQVQSGSVIGGGVVAMAAKLAGNIVAVLSLLGACVHCAKPGSGEGGDAVWVAMATSGGLGSIGIATSWCLDKRCTGRLKMAMPLGQGDVLYN